MYEVFHDDPERGQRFANAMSFHARSPVFAVDHLVSGFDWVALGSAVVVDVSGYSSGPALTNISIADNVARLAAHKAQSRDN
jgi:hypothetical protein